MIIKKRHQIFLITLFLFFSIEVQASLVKGIYGIPSIKEKDLLIYISQLKKARVNAVFVPVDKDTVSFFKEHGLKVFISVNVFGGRSAWKKYPDARPLKSDGTLLGSEPGYNCIGISAGNDNAGVWYSALADCEPGEEYLFKGLFYRYRWENGKYPYISLWGQEFRISSHWLTKTFQPIQVHVTCPDTMTDPTIRFINHNPGETMWLTLPRLTRNFRARASLKSQNVSPDFFNEFFPIGVYGAQLDNLEQLKSIGINTVIAGGHGQALKNTILKCKQLGLRYVITVPRDPDRLYVFLNEISKYVLFEDTAFYVNDEPGIHSFPTSTANDIQRLIKDRFPMSATCMAVVRPQVCRDYLQAADLFMMDQYPVPYMPMIWRFHCYPLLL